MATTDSNFLHLKLPISLSGQWGAPQVKYDSNGNQLWVARYDGPVNNYDAATALAVDGAGNVYVTGYSTDTSAGYFQDFATVKYVHTLSQDESVVGSGESANVSTGSTTSVLGAVSATV